MRDRRFLLMFLGLFDRGLDLFDGFQTWGQEFDAVDITETCPLAYLIYPVTITGNTRSGLRLVNRCEGERAGARGNKGEAEFHDSSPFGNRSGLNLGAGLRAPGRNNIGRACEFVYRVRGRQISFVVSPIRPLRIVCYPAGHVQRLS